jgi:signal transduction histidine kinase
MGAGDGKIHPTAREASAQAGAAARLARDRSRLRPLTIAMIAIVIVSTAVARPAPSPATGTGLALLASLAVFCAGAVAAMYAPRTGHPGPRLAAGTAMGAAGVAIAALQPHGASELPASAAVFTVALIQQGRVALGVGAAITLALDTASALRGAGVGAVAAETLLCVLLIATARLQRGARDGQDRAELLYAQLLDARDAQAAAAAVAERGRIAAELHDVLAHSLSGAAIQLQGARKLLERGPAEPRVLDAVGRAAELVREGLDDARRAVSALHGAELPTVEQIPALVADFRRDHGVPTELTVVGEPRRLGADASLALFRGAQEALTNAARYAPGAPVTVRLCHAEQVTTLSIANGRGAVTGDSAAAGGLEGAGGGHGLAGMQERITRAGGTMQAGATPDGWLVELEVPA